jgi:hypothetical protein
VQTQTVLTIKSLRQKLTTKSIVQMNVAGLQQTKKSWRNTMKKKLFVLDKKGIARSVNLV